MADRLRTLPAVADASIEVALPDTIRVRLVERRPIVVWQVDGRRFLVDADRVVFAEADGPSDLPVIVDKREPTAGRGDPTDRDEAARLPQPRIPGSATRSTRSTSTRRPGSARSARPTSAAAPRRSG